MWKSKLQELFRFNHLFERVSKINMSFYKLISVSMRIVSKRTSNQGLRLTCDTGPAGSWIPPWSSRWTRRYLAWREGPSLSQGHPVPAHHNLLYIKRRENYIENNEEKPKKIDRQEGAAKRTGSKKERKKLKDWTKAYWALFRKY